MTFPLAAFNLNLPPWVVGLFIGAGVAAVVLFGFVCYWLNRKPDGPIDPGVPEKDQANGRCGMILFGSVFVLAGLVALFFITLRPIYRSYRADGWPVVRGTVVSSRVQESHSSDGTTYRIDIQYRFPANGKWFESNQYDSNGTHTFSGQLSHHQAVVRGHWPGKEVAVHYNPADPTDAMLTTELPKGTLSFVWFPLVFIGSGLAVMFIPAKFNLGTNRKPVAAKAAPRAASQVDVGAVRKKRAGQALGIGIFAFIWNAFVAGFYFLGDGTWCMIPFALVGVFVIIMAVHATLQVFNPAVGVTFARMPLWPGESTNVSFALAGNIFAVRQLTFTLEGREKVTYRQGTDTKTETHAAWRIPCYETTRHVDMERGQFTINLPADVMTTFIASNNQFTWHLICHGDVPGRPDMKDEFDVTVLPHEKRGDH